MSIIDRPSPTIAQQRLDDVCVLTPRGALDRDLAVEARHAVLQARAPVVLDLTECVLVDPGALLHLVSGWDLYRPEMCIVCRRVSALGLLRRAGVAAHVPIFPSVPVAVASRPGGWTAALSA